MNGDASHDLSQAEAAHLWPRGVEFLRRLEANLPPGQFRIGLATLFARGTTAPQEVGWVAVALIGYEKFVEPLEFDLDDDPEKWAIELMRWRAKHVGEISNAELGEVE